MTGKRKTTIGEQLSQPEGSPDDFQASLVRPRRCYRVWMKDGYASLHDAESEAIAKAAAIALATKNTEGLAMTPAERRKAITVDYVTCLTS